MWFMSKTKTSWRKINALFHTVTLIFVQSGNLDHSDSFELRILLGKLSGICTCISSDIVFYNRYFTHFQPKHDVTGKSSQPTVSLQQQPL